MSLTDNLGEVVWQVLWRKVYENRKYRPDTYGLGALMMCSGMWGLMGSNPMELTGLIQLDWIHF
ncbi:MAG: hypothetical protein EB828_03605 [Nitrosopumilus sp. D6]|nr:MAG: hypothetical protein EB828_03605 [Nitrosopumilus sp. D6]